MKKIKGDKMVIFLKKRNIILSMLALVFSLVLAVSLFPKASPAAAKKAKTIVIDAGHGMPDGGAVGASGALEAPLNLDVAMHLAQCLKKDGHKIIMTRKDENGIFDDGAASTREKKVSDMHAREKIMNESGADLFLSIHMNKFEIAKYSGPQVFYAPQFEEGKALAEAIQKSLIADLKPEKEREAKMSDGNIYLLKKAQIPAILIECGFLSNPDEEKLLLNESYRKKLAESIAKAVNQHFKNP